MQKKLFLFFFSLALFTQTTFAQFQVNLIDSSKIEHADSIRLSSISFRGLSVVNDKIIWVSGSKGCFARSIDGGKTFQLKRIAGFDSADFRDIEAFDANTAIMMSSGHPSYILKTFDGGAHWNKVFEHQGNELFLDAMDFWDAQNGIVIGDPIAARFVFYRTSDGGNTWQALDVKTCPWAVEGESLFAASGTCMRCMPNNSVAFVTGGSKASFHWLQIGKKYQHFELKSLPQGQASMGAFSFAFTKDRLLIVGGDYNQDTALTKQGIYTYTYTKDGLALLNPKPFYTNYRSSVEFMQDGEHFISCGTKGADINSTELTLTRQNTNNSLSNLSFNVIRKAKKGKLLVMAGNKGKIAIIQ